MKHHTIKCPNCGRDIKPEHIKECCGPRAAAWALVALVAGATIILRELER